MSFLLIIKTWVVDNHNMCNFNYTVMPHTKDTKISQYAKKSYQNLRVTITLCDVSFFLAFLWLDFPESVDKRNAKSTINVFHFFSVSSHWLPQEHIWYLVHSNNKKNSQKWNRWFAYIGVLWYFIIASFMLNILIYSLRVNIFKFIFNVLSISI